MAIVKVFEEIKKNFDQEFTGIACDSRLIQPENLFFAITCDHTVDHIRQALAGGARAVIIDQDYYNHVADQIPQATYIPVPSVRAKFAEFAVHLYPGQPDINVAVTGTNGKSSVVAFVRQIWGAIGYPSVSLGTLGAEFSATTAPEAVTLPKLTTPDALSFHQFLHQLKVHDVNHFAFEASSHGLDQYRCHQVQLTAAGFTNLTQDHIDYHGSIENYFEAKQRLFSEVLAPGKTAVINAHSDYAKSLMYLISSRRHKVITYGIDEEADLIAHHVRLHNTQIRFDLEYEGRQWQDICLNMVGAFQVENVLCAIGLVIASGEDIDCIIPTLPQLTSAQGRMQLASRLSDGAAIFVDYAHTPDALKRSLQALRHHLPLEGRLHVVFGCGGDRDVGKRQLMGAIAQELADVVYVTDDNPRFEDPAYIRTQIMRGCPKALEVGQREEAIQQAISRLEPQDILLIAGKGHEVGQIIRDQILPFDDFAIVQNIVKDAK